MNLRDIYVLCRDNRYTILQLKGEETAINGRTGVKITGWEKCREAVKCLINAAPLEEECRELVESIPEVFVTKDSFAVSREEFIQIKLAKENLGRTMDDIMDLYEKMGMSTDEEVGLNIKLPKFNDFAEFVKYINDIEFVFSKCPFLQRDDEKLEFENVDIGSTWLTFFVAGSTALVGGSILLNNIAAFIDKCIIIRSHYLTAKKQKAELEAEKRNEEEKKIILNYIDGIYKKQVDEAIKELEDITQYSVENKDGDELNRISQCFEKMGALIEKGLQIRASVDSPGEAKALFAPLEMKYLEISDTLKLLEKKEK